MACGFGRAAADDLCGEREHRLSPLREPPGYWQRAQPVSTAVATHGSRLHRASGATHRCDAATHRRQALAQGAGLGLGLTLNLTLTLTLILTLTLTLALTLTLTKGRRRPVATAIIDEWRPAPPPARAPPPRRPATPPADAQVD